ncbi:acyltransferase family protein [Sphingomonas bacterium]
MHSDLSKKKEFDALHGLRGVAALIVVLYHYQQSRPGTSVVFSSGYLAVDLFFVLSGFVIGYVYEHRLETTLSLLRFVEIRLIRLYPLYFLGCLITLSGVAIHIARTHELWVMKAYLRALLPAIVILPKIDETSGRWFVLNPPAWSLFYELVFNFLYARFLPVLTSRRVAVGVFSSLIVLLGYSWYFGALDQGSSSWVLGPFRATYGLGLGVLLFRAWERRVLITIKLPLVIPPLIFLIIGTFPSNGAVAAPLITLSLVCLIPLTTVTAIKQETLSGPIRSAMLFLGNLSYPIYALHWPIMEICRGLLWHRIDDVRIVDVITFFATMLASWLAVKLYDRPVRNWISKQLKIRRSLVAVAPAL